MATKIKMLKMVQEAQALAEITNRRPQNRPAGPLTVGIRFAGSKANARRRRIIRIKIEDPPDIPHPVKITYLRSSKS